MDQSDVEDLQRLVNALEEERRQVARQLHDDIGQRLAVLSIALDMLGRGKDALPTEVRQGIAAALDQVMLLAKDVQSLSHRLHPARLEYLGIAAAADALCREVSTERAVDIACHADGVPEDVPSRVAIHLYRVLQDALQNTIKHPGTATIDVTLHGSGDDIALVIRDPAQNRNTAPQFSRVFRR